MPILMTARRDTAIERFSCACWLEGKSGLQLRRDTPDTAAIRHHFSLSIHSAPASYMAAASEPLRISASISAVREFLSTVTPYIIETRVPGLAGSPATSAP